MTQLSFDLGAALKRDGQRAAIEAAGDWADRAIAALRTFLANLEPGQAFAIEDFRQWAAVTGELDPPSHHNAWGALPRLAILEELIAWTGEYRPAVSARTHAHPVRLYVRGRA